MRKKHIYFLVAGAIPLLCLSAQAVENEDLGRLPELKKTTIAAPDMQKAGDVFIEADNMDYNTQSKIITASGRVEILKGENVLFADNVSYDQNTNFVTASGNVSVVGKEGNAIFTDKFVLKDDFNQGVINYFSSRLSDGSLIAAATAQRSDKDNLVLHKAVYSPCPICSHLPDSNPQWQLKADTVTVDNVAQKVTYDDATLEVYGLPVMYTPYFAHATPGADRKSGFLIPTLGTDSNLGVTATIPYYWNIAPNMDFTAEPVLTTKAGEVIAGELRHNTEYGDYKLIGSITKPHNFDDDRNEKSLRGHLQGVGKFDLSQHWDLGFDGEYVSDDTYLRRYNYGNQDLITSRLYAERIEDRDYIILQGVHFHGLLEQDNSATTPVALPYFQSHTESAPGIIPAFLGSKIWADVAGSGIARDDGDDNQRASVTTGLTVPFTFANGQIVELEGSLRGDQYYMEDSSYDNREHRFIPEATATWRYPLINQLGSSSKLLLEPIAKLVISPNKNYNSQIVNEDSQDIEFSDLNVFDNNRFSGLDRIESGTRIYYGLRGGYYENNYSVSYLFGQDYRFGESKSLPPVNSGIEDNLSDYVGRISASFYDKFDLAYKFRLDKDDYQPRRSEVDASLDMDPVKFSLTYFNLDYDFTSNDDNREEISGLVQVKVADEWSVLTGGQRNLSEGKNINARVGVLYEGDCTNILTTVEKTFLSDRDAKSGTSFSVQLGLKNLGNL